MPALMWSPLVASAVLGLAGPWLARTLPPATAVRLLTVAVLVSALSTGFVLAVAGFVVLAQLPLVGVLGHWSVTALGAGHPVHVAQGILAGTTVLLLLAAATRRALHAGRDLLAAALVCRRLDAAAGGLVVVDDEHPDAYALPGIRGRVVVSTAMLRALSADERRVLLAHEAAHLRRGHHLYVQVAELAAAANPLLIRAARAVGTAVERDADEIAATEVGNRALAACALARAGLARAAAPVRRRPPCSARWPAPTRTSPIAPAHCSPPNPSPTPAPPRPRRRVDRPHPGDRHNIHRDRPPDRPTLRARPGQLRSTPLTRTLGEVRWHRSRETAGTSRRS